MNGNRTARQERNAQILATICALIITAGVVLTILTARTGGA